MKKRVIGAFKVKGKEGIFFEKILKSPNFTFFIMSCVILLNHHYSWWIALFNSIAIVIFNVLSYGLAQNINRNRIRYFPSWLPFVISVIPLLIMVYLGSIVSLWILFFVVFIVSIIFPVKSES